MKRLCFLLFSLSMLCTNGFAQQWADNLFGLDAIKKMEDLSRNGKDLKFDRSEEEIAEGEAYTLWTVDGTLDGKRWSCDHAIPLSKVAKDSLLKNFKMYHGNEKAKKALVRGTFYICSEVSMPGHL